MRSFAYIEEQKLNLDEEINQILQGVDITKVFDDIREGLRKDAATEQVQKGQEQKYIITDLVDKIQRR